MTYALIELAMANRARNGLKLTFLVPADDIQGEHLFTCYPRDHAQKDAWLEKYQGDGWIVVPDQ